MKSNLNPKLFFSISLLIVSSVIFGITFRNFIYSPDGQSAAAKTALFSTKKLGGSNITYKKGDKVVTVAPVVVKKKPASVLSSGFQKKGTSAVVKSVSYKGTTAYVELDFSNGEDGFVEMANVMAVGDGEEIVGERRTAGGGVVFNNGGVLNNINNGGQTSSGPGWVNTNGVYCPSTNSCYESEGEEMVWECTESEVSGTVSIPGQSNAITVTQGNNSAAPKAKQPIVGCLNPGIPVGVSPPGCNCKLVRASTASWYDKPGLCSRKDPFDPNAIKGAVSNCKKWEWFRQKINNPNGPGVVYAPGTGQYEGCKMEIAIDLTKTLPAGVSCPPTIKPIKVEINDNGPDASYSGVDLTPAAFTLLLAGCTLPPNKTPMDMGRVPVKTTPVDCPPRR